MTRLIQTIEHLLQPSSSLNRQVHYTLPTVIKWRDFSVLQLWLHSWFTVRLPPTMPVIILPVGNQTRQEAKLSLTAPLGHVTSSVMWPFDSPKAISYWWSFGTKPQSLTVTENVECNTMVDVTLIWLLNEGQGHSFWYQSISHIRLPIGSQ